MDNALCPRTGDFRLSPLSGLFPGLCGQVSLLLGGPRRPSGKPPASPRCQANHTPVSHKPGAGTTLCPCAGRRGGLQRGEPTSERSPVGTCPPGQSPVSHKSLSPAHPFDTTHCSFKGEDQGYKFSKGPFQALCYWVRLIWGGLGAFLASPKSHQVDSHLTPVPASPETACENSWLTASSSGRRFHPHPPTAGEGIERSWKETEDRRGTSKRMR